MYISGDTVILRAIAVGAGYIPVQGSWIYIRSLTSNYASLNADPGSTIYNDSRLEVTLTSEEGNSIYYTTDGSQPDTSDATQLYEGPIIISGDVELRAIAFGPDYLAIEKSWVYDCELGTALLTADPADTAYSTNSLEVTLSTNAERIYYTTDGSNPDTNDAGQLYSEPVYISGDTVILRAIAVGAGYIPVQGSWIYIRSLTSNYASLNADPGSTIYNDSRLEVTLTSEEGNSIYYTTDGSQPDTSDATQLYEGPIIISGDVELRAIAFGPDYLAIEKSWVYDCELPYASLTADPGNTDTIYFNDSLEVTLSTNAERIYYTTDGSTPDTSDAEQLYSDPVYISGDTVILRAIAVGAGYIPVQGSWIYIRSLTSNYASLNADPGSTIYNDSTLEVTLTSEEGNSIYYTTDGSEPDTNNISQLYEEPITISGDVTLRAIAIGPDYLAIEKSWVYDCELN